MMALRRKMMKELRRVPQSQNTSSGVGIHVYKETGHYKTYLVKIDEDFGFGVTVFREDDAPLVSEESVKAKVVFIAVDTTASMSGVILDVSKQISTILRMSSNLLPVKIILALYADYENNTSDVILIRNIHFIHVCSEREASKALLDFWNSSVQAAGGGDIPEMNLTLMATIIKYYRGIIGTKYDQIGFQVTGTHIACPDTATGDVNSAIIQISDAVNRDPIVHPNKYNTLEAKLEMACLQKYFPSFSQWSDIDTWCRENNVPFIRIHLGLPYMLAMNKKSYQVGPQCSLMFVSIRNEPEVRLGSFLIALMTCLLDMTSLEIIGKYKDDFILPLLEDQHQFPQEHITEHGEDYNKIESLRMESTKAVEEIWRQKTGHVPEYSRGQVVIETLGMDEAKKEYYFNLCMEVCRSDYYSLMISNPVFAEVITAFKTVWSHKQVKDFNDSMSERCNMASKEDIKSYRAWAESGKTMEVSVRALINQLMITPMGEEAECEIVRVKDETARDKKSLISDFTMQNPKTADAIYRFIKALVVVKTTKSALKSELHQYILSKDSGVTTFSPVIHQSDLPHEVIAEAESEQNEAFNLDALELRGVLRLYNSNLFLKDLSLISFAMMCDICTRQGECNQRIGHMGKKYLASLRKRGVNWLEDPSNPARIKPEACGALYSMVIRPFWELYADKEWADVRNTLLTESCWKYMNTMVVMQCSVYNNVRVPVVEVKKTVECQRFSVLPSVLEVSDAVKDRHFVVCQVCERHTFRGATLSNVCVSCRYNEHLVFRCKNAKKGYPDSEEPAASRNCIHESNVRSNFSGEMYCKKCLLPDDSACDEGSKKQMVSFLVCRKCSNTYTFSGKKDLKRTPLCFVCTFVNILRKKFKNEQDLESFFGDMSNPTDMVIQLGIASSCEEGSSRLADQDSFWRWVNESRKARQMSQLKAESVEMRNKNYHRHFEKTLRKLCGMSLLVGEQEDDDIHGQDVPQNPRGEGDALMRLPQKEKKMSKANKRKEYKAYLKTLHHKERMAHIYKRREKRSKKRESIAEMKKRRKLALQSSNYENLLRKLRDTFKRTCPKCNMTVVCSPEANWEGCLVCDGVVDPQTSSFFQQVQKRLSEVVPLDVLNSLVLADVGVKLSAESWKDVVNFTSVGQFFRSLEILSSQTDVEKIDMDNEAAVNDEHRTLEKVNFHGKPFNHTFIYNHCMVLKKGLEGRDLTSKEINEMKGACLLCGDIASYMYSLHKDGNCSGMMCRCCTTKYYWSMIKDAHSTPMLLSGWLSCMFCKQFCDNMHNLWIWIRAKHNITNAIEGITTEESTYFRNVLNAMPKRMFMKLSLELDSSPDAIYSICNKCLQLKRVPEDQVALPPVCGAPEPSKVRTIMFECEDCVRPVNISDAYPDNTVEAALLRHQLTTNANTGLTVISSKELMRPCPSCKHDIVKDGGCLAMECPVQNCRTSFCFICGSVEEDHYPIYEHLRERHYIDYMGSDEDEQPNLRIELVKTASGNQHMYVFDTEKYYFDTKDMSLVERDIPTE